MTSNNYKLLAASILLLFSSNSYSLGASGWTTVTQIYQGQGSTPLVSLSNMGQTVTTCKNKTYVQFKNADSSVGKRHLSTLLAALTSGREVNITTLQCSSSYAVIDTIRMR